MLLSAMLLTACTRTAGPRIAFLGMSTGSLLQPAETLAFTDAFRTTDRELLGVVNLDRPADGGRVVGQWYMPDDRSPPVGQSAVALQSGATLARFSFASRTDWQAGPRMFKAFVYDEDIAADPDARPVASGSLHFFIGMTPEEIARYGAAYTEWQRRDREKRSAIHVESVHEERILQWMRDALDAPEAILGARWDLTGDELPEYVVLDTRGLPPLEMTEFPIILSQPVRTFALANHTGEMVIGIREKKGKRELIEGKQSIAELPLKESAMVTLIAPSELLVTSTINEAVCVFRFTWEPNMPVHRETWCNTGDRATEH